jgi:hypothetical protein
MFSSTECAAERDGTHHQVQLIHEIVGQQSVPQDPAAEHEDVAAFSPLEGR